MNRIEIQSQPERLKKYPQMLTIKLTDDMSNRQNKADSPKMTGEGRKSHAGSYEEDYKKKDSENE